jgi:DNA-binding HxlR family transcriptional regulator
MAIMECYVVGGRTFICPVQAALSTVAGKWKGLIVWGLLNETPVMRYGELRKAIHEYVRVTDRMLIQSLKELEADGIIRRTVFATVPPRVEYQLTEAGQQLRPVFETLESFGLRYWTPSHQRQETP